MLPRLPAGPVMRITGVAGAMGAMLFATTASAQLPAQTDANPPAPARPPLTARQDPTAPPDLVAPPVKGAVKGLTAPRGNPATPAVRQSSPEASGKPDTRPN